MFFKLILTYNIVYVNIIKSSLIKGANMNKIITIGREFGSGGREFGKKLAEQLGFAYYDWEIVEEIAKRTELSEEYVKGVLERRPVITYPIHTAISFTSTYYDAHFHDATIYNAQKAVLIELAEKSNCVIVGRCADYILRNFNPFRIFVYADIKSKLARCKKNEKNIEFKNDKKFMRHIKKVDRERARYYSFYTGREWGNKLNYDLCINTTDVNIDDVVPHVAKMLSDN